MANDSKSTVVCQTPDCCDKKSDIGAKLAALWECPKRSFRLLSSESTSTLRASSTGSAKSPKSSSATPPAETALISSCAEDIIFDKKRAGADFNDSRSKDWSTVKMLRHKFFVTTSRPDSLLRPDGAGSRGSAFKRDGILGGAGAMFLDSSWIS